MLGQVLNGAFVALLILRVILARDLAREGRLVIRAIYLYYMYVDITVIYTFYTSK